MPRSAVIHTGTTGALLPQGTNLHSRNLARYSAPPVDLMGAASGQMGPLPSGPGMFGEPARRDALVFTLRLEMSF